MHSPRLRTYCGLALTASLALSLAGCSGDSSHPEPPASTEGASATPTPTPQVPSVDTSGLSAELGELATQWYTGAFVPVGDRATAAAQARTTSSGHLTVDAATGTWNGQEVAVLTAGDDVTLAVSAAEGWTIVGGWWPSLGLNQPALGDGPRHLLFAGSDAREKEGEDITRARADALQVVGVDGMGGGAIVGIPRDLWVPMASGGNAKINAALVFDGPEGQQQAVENATGFELDGYVLTGFLGFQAIVEEAGGLPMDAPVPVKNVSAGEVLLNPVDALMYVRERKTLPGGDFDRSFHQGIALLGFGANALLEGPQALAGALSLVDPHVVTNVSAEDMLTFAAWLYRTDLTQVGHTVPDAPFGTSADGQSILVNDDGVQSVFDDFADGHLGE
ncbi:LCP family protein [Zhihengliuella flava]|uniref:LCP family protein required for cell wall assembly n=1 Tax=Zhihengliuella flava TaxID=1285193 RepID=A0A931DBB0_9MICC|nr:LCP family protein [Zhihengliuella flava]MBG6083580.1 LCP family protein required for cell wall assembly [Zhihengliuella flava]